MAENSSTTDSVDETGAATSVESVTKYTDKPVIGASHNRERCGIQGVRNCFGAEVNAGGSSGRDRRVCCVQPGFILPNGGRLLSPSDSDCICKYFNVGETVTKFWGHTSATALTDNDS